ncbi:unnamed protein product [Moneuplotes crassus]|uniref:Homeobox domain-containing protein n=1 Tax=Euplotes crassus TaxID=5936 RepID=A0AAD1Y8Y8_EUPCR|nr:unnamed protein product [Moneuplotes crassus]
MQSLNCLLRQLPVLKSQTHQRRCKGEPVFPALRLMVKSSKKITCEEDIQSFEKFNIPVKGKDVSKRSNYSPIITNILMKWLLENEEYPYPNRHDREALCKKTGLTRKQLRIWLINARKRKIKKTTKNPKINLKKSKSKNPKTRANRSSKHPHSTHLPDPTLSPTLSTSPPDLTQYCFCQSPLSSPLPSLRSIFF